MTGRCPARRAGSNAIALASTTVPIRAIAIVTQGHAVSALTP